MPLISACPQGTNNLPKSGHIPENGLLLLWHIDESEEVLERLVTAEDRESAARLGSTGRRREHLAWRAALRTVLPDAVIKYNSLGAPIIDDVSYPQCLSSEAHGHSGSSDRHTGNKNIHISVSHTRGLAAVRISERPCGVDVELAERDMSALRARFVSAEEEKLADASRDDFAASVWCAKEVMYKMSGRRGLDFLQDLKIEDSDLANDTIAGMRMLRIGEWIIVFI